MNELSRKGCGRQVKGCRIKCFSRLLSFVFCILIFSGQASFAKLKNVIILIGDGMGFEQVKAASMYAYGREGMLTFEQFYRGEVTTHSANSYLQSYHATDSAAASTAMATGHKVKNGVISEDANKPLETLLEYSKQAGKTVGLVTTVFMTDATPAGFAAHSESRDDGNDIADNYLEQSRPNIFLGAYYSNVLPDRKVRLAGYEIVKTRQQMLEAIERASQKRTTNYFIAGLFTEGKDIPYEYDYYRQKGILLPFEGMNLLSYDVIPHLSEMALAALPLLDKDPNGFFMLAEGGSIDHAGHDNLIERSVYATLEFEQLCVGVLNWIWDRDDTLVVITADHETGGMKVVKNKGRGFMPDVFWGATDHSGANVPLYTAGYGADEFVGVIDNTDIFKTIMKLLNK